MSDYPSLLPAGLHPLSLAEVRVLCVDAFPLSASRGAIMGGLESVVDDLGRQGIEGEIWVDGSFLTGKIDPRDVDIVLRIRAQFYDEAPPAQQAVIEMIGSNLKNARRCDSYVFAEWPEGHPLHEAGRRLHDYWLGWFGHDRSGAPKGIAVLTLGGGGP